MPGEYEIQNLVSNHRKLLTPINTLHVQLLPQMGGSDTQVLMQNSESGDRINRFHAPFDDQTAHILYGLLEKGDLYLGEMTSEERETLAKLNIRPDQGFASVINRIGELLYESLFPFSEDKDTDLRGGVQIALTSVRKDRQHTTCLPVLLKFGDPSARYGGLPWELLCDENGPLLLGDISLSRYITMGESIPSIPIQDRLEVLLIVSRPTDLVHIDERDEHTGIETALRGLERQGSLRLTVVNPPTFAKLEECLNNNHYDIIHFDGHGELVWKCSQCGKTRLYIYDKCGPDCGQVFSEEVGDQVQGRLAFEAPTPHRRSDLIDQEKLGRLLSKKHVPLFFASACQSGIVGGKSIFNNISPQLIRSGVLAVVGMQFSIPAKSSVIFAAAFYSALAEGLTLPECVMNGRIALSNDRSTSSPTWYIPVLYLREIEGQGKLFQLPKETASILIGEDNNAQVYFRCKEITGDDWRKLHTGRSLYPFLRPFNIRDRAVFFGREDSTALLLTSVMHDKLTILWGAHCMGKSSLVNAGLIPKLLESDYLVLALNGYTNPSTQLHNLLEKYLPQSIPRLRRPREELVIDGADDSAVTGLNEIIDDAMQAFDRPVMLVLDELDHYLATANASDCRMLGSQIQDCIQSGHRQALSILLVLSNLGLLDKLQILLPEVYRSRIELTPLTPNEARKAMTGPLILSDKRASMDPSLVEQLIKHDLCSPPTEGLAGNEETALEYSHGMDTKLQSEVGIAPAFLQIVCHQLYQEAIHMDQEKPESEKTGELWIGMDLYKNLDTTRILSEHIEKILRENFGDPVKRSQVRKILTALVDPCGNRLMLATSQAANLISTPRADTDVICAVLEDNNILEQTLNSEGELSYRLSHVLIAREVSTWFDREEAIVRCAQDTLNRVWNNWKEEWQVNHKSVFAGTDQLLEIMQKRPDLEIHPGQLALLLRSAVHRNVCVDYWVGQFLDNPFQLELLNQQARKGRELLTWIQAGGAGPHSDGIKNIDESLQALGLDGSYVGDYGLARAAVSHPDETGVTRHTAALGLGVLGKDQLLRSLPTLSASNGTQFWRSPRALAQIGAAGLPLPDLPALLRLQVAGWWAGIKIYTERFRILARLVSTSLLTGWGLLAIAAIIFLLCKFPHLPTIYSFFVIGSGFGLLYALGFSLLDGLFHSSLARIAGGMLGMLLSVPAFAPYLQPTGNEQWLNELARFSLFCLCMGGGASMGIWLARRVKPASYTRLGIGLSGLFCGSLFLLLYASYRIDILIRINEILLASNYPEFIQRVIEFTAYPMVGAMIGVSLTGGILLGDILLKFLDPHHVEVTNA